MSMQSGPNPGDDEGIGGVVTPSHPTGGVVVPSASATISTSHSSCYMAQCLTSSVQLQEKIRGEERPARSSKLRAGTMVNKRSGGARACKGGHDVDVPLVDMEVGSHVGRQTRGWRRPSYRRQGEVVGAWLLHAHVPEVEVGGAERVACK